MYITVPIALFGYLVVGPLFFVLLTPRRAVIACMLVGTMFLPNAGYYVPVLRTLDKGTATVLATLLGVLLFDGSRISRYRFSWVDLPMIVWCLCPFVSSITNGLGGYDGLAEIVSQLNVWGVPYFIARLYVWDREGVKELVVSLMVAGLVYVPFCVWEMKGGPFFHSRVYGFYPHNYWEQLKPGGWRPSVFFVHGLWLAGFMAYASICALCIWRTKLVTRIFGIPSGFLAIAVILTLLNSKSNGAIQIFIFGAVCIFAARFRRLACILLIATPLLYTTLRITGLWSGEDLVSYFGGKSTNAGGSLNTRLDLENRIIGRALQSPIFGWGGYNRAFQIETSDSRGTWTEAIWTYAIGPRGLVGLEAWMLSGLVPAWVALRHLGRSKNLTPEDGAVLALILLVPMHTIYGLVVLDFSPLNPMFSGALAGMATLAPAALRRAIPKPKPVASRYSLAASPSLAPG